MPKGVQDEIIDWEKIRFGQIHIPEELIRKFKTDGYDLGWVRHNRLSKKRFQGWVPVTPEEANGLYHGIDGMARYEDLVLCKRLVHLSESKRRYLEKLNHEEQNIKGKLEAELQSIHPDASIVGEISEDIEEFGLSKDRKTVMSRAKPISKK